MSERSERIAREALLPDGAEHPQFGEAIAAAQAEDRPPHYSIPAEVHSDIMDAQADLQTALGFLRLYFADGGDDIQLRAIEDRMSQSLARTHSLLAICDHPMMAPHLHDYVYYPELADPDYRERIARVEALR